MKKNIVILSICLFALAQVNAQIEQGTILVGGYLGFNTSSSTSTTIVGGTTTTVDNPTYSSFNLGPWIGYLVTEDLAVGLGLNYGQSKTETVDAIDPQINDTYTTSMFTITPSARYYYAHGDLVHLYGQLNIPIGFGKVSDKYTDGNTDTEVLTDVSTFGVGISPGATIKLTDACGLDFSYGFLGFSSYKESGDREDYMGDPYQVEYKSSTFGLGWSNTFTFGILFNF